ncbi:Uncharacterised protein [Cedecea lapagei]|uniref:Cupin domain n=1 Tax=Cedecea lapagei TaxID=158823 RepID=A0A3S4MCB5_9ENTR|nr:Uncharacterised protein [Cedecea lapagei]
MNITDLPFNTTDWATLTPTEHPGITGKALWRTQQFGPIRVRMVEYTPGYLADHWCQKGHVLLCLKGELQTELEDGRQFTLTPGMSRRRRATPFLHHIRRSPVYCGLTPCRPF